MKWVGRNEQGKDAKQAERDGGREGAETVPEQGNEELD